MSSDTGQAAVHETCRLGWARAEGAGRTHSVGTRRLIHEGEWHCTATTGSVQLLLLIRVNSVPNPLQEQAVMEESEYLALDIGLLLPKSLTLSMFFWLQWLML